jgi:hypothetical protein
MQEDIRKKVFLDVFVSKSTLLPIVAGGSVSLISLGMDLYPLAFMGLTASLVGVGIFATRLIFNLDKITENAFNYLQEKKQEELEVDLDKLQESLTEKDAEQLKLLRNAYNHHKDQIAKEAIVTSDELEDKLEKLFKGCIEQLKYASELSDTAKTLTKDAKKGVLEKRQQVLTEIKDSVQCFHSIIDEICAINTDKSTKGLSDLRAELQSSFDVIKRTEARVAELDNNRSE